MLVWDRCMVPACIKSQPFPAFACIGCECRLHAYRMPAATIHDTYVNLPTCTSFVQGASVSGIGHAETGMTTPAQYMWFDLHTHQTNTSNGVQGSMCVAKAFKFSFSEGIFCSSALA